MTTELAEPADLAGDVEVRVDRSGPDDVVWLSTRDLLLGAVPALGGRLLAARLRGEEVLYRNAELVDERLHRRPDDGPSPDGTMATWRNYGGDKTWPAPQGWDNPARWAGPPDPVLDSGGYHWRLARGRDETTLVMRSAADPRTGLRVERELTVQAGRSTVLITSRLHNTTDRPLRWAAWDVLQLPAPSVGSDEAWHASVDGRAAPVIELLAGTGFPRWLTTGPVVRVPGQDVIGKLGIPGAAGWAATVSGGHTVTQRFDVNPAAEYPDGGARVEVWLEFPRPVGLSSLGGLRPTARILESEVLGPLEVIAPGDATDLRVELGVARATGVPAAVGEAGIVFEPLEARRTSSVLTLAGRYATFVRGTLACRGRDSAGNLVASVSLGRVEAGGGCAVDVVMQQAESLRSVEVVIEPFPSVRRPDKGGPACQQQGERFLDDLVLDRADIGGGR